MANDKKLAHKRWKEELLAAEPKANKSLRKLKPPTQTRVGVVCHCGRCQKCCAKRANSRRVNKALKARKGAGQLAIPEDLGGMPVQTTSGKKRSR